MLDRHCVDVGRDPATVQRTMMVPFDVFGRDEPFDDEFTAYADAGIDLTIFVPYGDPIEYLERCHDSFMQR